MNDIKLNLKRITHKTNMLDIIYSFMPKDSKALLIHRNKDIFFSVVVKEKNKFRCINKLAKGVWIRFWRRVHREFFEFLCEQQEIHLKEKELRKESKQFVFNALKEFFFFGPKIKLVEGFCIIINKESLKKCVEIGVKSLFERSVLDKEHHHDIKLGGFWGVFDNKNFCELNISYGVSVVSLSIKFTTRVRKCCDESIFFLVVERRK